jgi:TonB family protein
VKFAGSPVPETAEWKTWEGCVVAGRFPLHQWLGGADGTSVFLTERPGQSGGRAAIKLVATGSAEADRLAERWSAAAQLFHPNLIRIFESGRAQVHGTPVAYVVMEPADEDLGQIIPQRALSPDEAGDLLPPLLDALSYLHSNGLVHGRIKPSNVHAVGEQLKLSSDHVVAAAETGSDRIRHDVFDAPETAAGIVSPAGDIWSVGVTLVAALTKGVPFVEDGQSDPGLPTSAPEPFRGIARESLHLDPRRRSSIAEIRARLRPPARTVAAEPEPVAVIPPSSGSGKVIGILVALVVVVVALVYFLRGSRSHEIPARVQPTTETQPPAAEIPKPDPAETLPQQGAQAARPAATPPAKPVSVVHPSSARSVPASVGSGVLRRVVPDVPASARRTITGTVRVNVRVNVDASGKVSQASLASPANSKYFANLALKAAQQWEFTPAQNDGRVGESAWLLHFQFRRGGTEVSPEAARH